MISGAEKENSLQPSQLCIILEACATYGVSKLKFGLLEVEFGKPTNPLAQPEVDPQNTSSVTALTESQHNEQTAKAIEQEEVRLKMERVANAIIDDPAEAERLILEEGLEDDDDSDDSIE